MANEAPRGSRVPWLLLAPAGLLYAIFFVLPIGTLAIQSFWQPTPGGAAIPDFTLENYANVFGDEHYLGIFFRSILLAIAVSVGTLVLGFPIAYGISRARPSLQVALLIGIVFPLLTSAVVRSFGWMVLLTRDGVVSTLLSPFGAQEGASGLMYTLAGVFIAMVHVFLPYMIFVLYGVVEQVDRDLEKAASSLGATRAQVVRHVLIPLTLPGVVAGTILVFTLGLSAFVTPQLIGGPRIKVIASAIYDQTIILLNWPFAGAMAVGLIVIVVTGTLAYTRFTDTQAKGIA